MKKLIVAGLALMIALPATAVAQGRGYGQDWREHRREYRDYQRENRRDYRDYQRELRRNHRDYQRGYGYRHAQPRHYHQPSYRYYAPPRYNYYRPSYGYGYGGGYYAPRWHRGMSLPPPYRRVIVHDYGYYGYPPPPYGHAYYRTDGGDIVLAAIATGLILSVFANAF